MNCYNQGIYKLTLRLKSTWIVCFRRMSLVSKRMKHSIQMGLLNTWEEDHSTSLQLKTTFNVQTSIHDYTIKSFILGLSVYSAYNLLIKNDNDRYGYFHKAFQLPCQYPTHCDPFIVVSDVMIITKYKNLNGPGICIFISNHASSLSMRITTRSTMWFFFFYLF